MAPTSEERWAEFVASHKAGDWVPGVVVAVTDSAVVIDLGGVKGRLSARDVPWGHGGPAFPEVGQQVRGFVLGFDNPQRIVVLGNAFQEQTFVHWKEAASRFGPGTRQRAEVVHVSSFGVGVMLEPGLDGIIPLAQLQKKRTIEDPREMYSVGDTVEVVVLSVHPERMEIVLGLA